MFTHAQIIDVEKKDFILQLWLRMKIILQSSTPSICAFRPFSLRKIVSSESVWFWRNCGSPRDFKLV